MAKKKNEATPQVVAEVGPEEGRKVNAEVQQAPKQTGIVTTEGNTIDKVKVYQAKNGSTMVQFDYGRLNKEGKTDAERRKGMVTVPARALSPDDAGQYQKLASVNPQSAKEFAVKQAFPMHMDDKRFHERDTVVGDRKVDYIILEKLDAKALAQSDWAKENGKTEADFKNVDGRWQISFGEKGKSRFNGLLNADELAMIRHRAEVTLGERGELKAIGAPLTLAEIAGKVEQRVTARREKNAALMEAAGKLDFSKYSLPEGVKVDGLYYAEHKGDKDRVWLNGKVNGIRVFALLNQKETAALVNKMATLEQMAAFNREFRDKVTNIAKTSQAQGAGVTVEEAVKAIVDRASDATARSFSPEQLKTLKDFVGEGASPEVRADLLGGLWDKAKVELDAQKVSEAWQQDAHEELNDLAQGREREQQQGMRR